MTRPLWRIIALLLVCASLASAQEATREKPDAKPGAKPETIKEEQKLFQPGSCGKSSLSIVSGIPVVRLEGAPEEIGKAYGRLLGREIDVLWKNYLEKAAGLSGGTEELVRIALEMDEHVPERFKREMRGLAEETEIDYGRTLAANAFPDIYRRGGCSTFAATGDATAGGAPLLARNLDFFGMGVLHRTGIVAVFRPKDCKPFVSVTWPGLSGVLSGMNADGLCCAVMEVRGAGDTTKGMPSVFLFRRVMEEAADVEKALAILKDCPKVAGNNLMLVDREGAAAVAEIGPGFCNVRRAEQGMLFSTNHHRSGIEKPERCRRYGAFEKFAASGHGAIDLEALERILLNVDQDLITVQAMIFEPTSLRLHLATGKLPATMGDYVTLECENFLQP